MKEFGDWMKGMANSIEDNSWTGQCIDGGVKPTPLQIRKMFADQVTNNDTDWMHVLCMGKYTSRGGTMYVKSILGVDMAQKWYSEKDEKAFCEALRAKIDSGWLPEDQI